ncbi:hypothetical protein AB0M86_42440 [Streptomyces sp. NPDC051639]|uniref:hypothetical protein n=1 Tax=Streptomyces sp. NPDC051639 TaxID=3155671 RepID=UPI0034401047
MLGLFQLNPWFGGLAGGEAGPDNWLVPAELDGLDDLVPLARLIAVQGHNGASLAPSLDVEPEEVPAYLAALGELFGQGHVPFSVVLKTDTDPSLPLLYGRGGQAPVHPGTFAKLVEHLGWSPQQPLVFVAIGDMLHEAGLLWLRELASVLGRPVHVLFDGQDLGGDDSSSHDGDPFVHRFVTEDATSLDILGEESPAEVFGWVRVLPRSGFTLPDDAWPNGTRWELDETEATSGPGETMDIDEESAAGAWDSMDTDDAGQTWYGGDPLAPEADRDAPDAGAEPYAPRAPQERPSWNTPAGRDFSAGVPVGVASAVGRGVVERLGGGLWWAARGSVLPELRVHRWMNPVSVSRDARGGLAQTTVNASFDVRRFRFGGETYTDLEVRVAFRDAASFLDRDRVVGGLWERLGAGVEEVFNGPGHRLPSGDVLHVTPVLVAPGSGVGAHWVAELFGAGSGQVVSHHRLRVDMSVWAGVHEFGHQLGLPDESRRSGEPESRLHVPGSLMGVYTEPVDSELVGGAGAGQELVGGGLAQGGLRDRHLHRLGRIIGDAPLATPDTAGQNTTGAPDTGIESVVPEPRWAGGDPTAPEAAHSAPLFGPSGSDQLNPTEQAHLVPEAVGRRVAEGLSFLPYRLREVTNGLADPARGGMSFQISVEFRLRLFDDLMEQEEGEGIRGVVAGMRTEGLSRQILPGQGVSSGWHVSGLSDNGTRMLTSPWLRDTEDDWRALQRAMSLTYNGAMFEPYPEGQTRMRVNVPGGLREGEQAALVELVRGHEDVLFRLAADPYTGSGPRYVRSLAERSRAGGSAGMPLPLDRAAAVHLAERGSPYVDFELWPATFDEDVQQARVLVSLALVNGARIRAAEPSPRPLAPEPPGTHARVVQKRLTDPDEQAIFRLDTAGELTGLKSLLNAMAIPAGDSHGRAAVTGLFAITPWFGGLAGQAPGVTPGLPPHGVPGLEDLVPFGRLSVAQVGRGLAFFEDGELDIEEEAEVAQKERVSFGRDDAFVLSLRHMTPNFPSLVEVDTLAGPRVLTAEQAGALLTAAGWAAGQAVLISRFYGAVWDEWIWPERLSAVLGQPVFVDVSGYGMAAGALRRADVFVSSDRFPTDLPSLTSGEDEVELPSDSWLRVAAEGVAVEDGPFSWPAGTDFVPYRPDVPAFDWEPGRDIRVPDAHDDRPRGFGEQGPDRVEADAVLRRALDGLLPGVPVPAEGEAVRIPAGVTGEYARGWWPQGPATAHVDVEAVVERIAGAFAEGRPFLPYFLNEATGGLADPARGGLTFGLEIEYSFPDGTAEADADERNRRILADLRSAGLTTQNDILGHGGAARAGYSEAPDGWLLERDSSVSGLELVAPIGRDTPRFWADFQQALGIIRGHGGVADADAGGHVHVGLRQFGNDVRRHTALWKMYRSFQDILVRLGTNPRLGQHRGSEYAQVMDEPSQGYTMVGDVIGTGEHRSALSFDSVSGVGSDHVEFRVKDGSLDGGEWQAWINVVLGLTHAALRAGDTSWQAPAPVLPGTHAGVVQEVRAAGPGGVRVFDAGREDETVGVRSFVDGIFWHPAIKAQVLGLFQLNPWFGGLAGGEAGPDNWLVPAELDGLDDLVPLGRVHAVAGAEGFSLTGRGEIDPAEVPAQLRAEAALFGGVHPAFLVRLGADYEPPSFFGTGGEIPAHPRTLVRLLRHLGWAPEQQPLALVPRGSLLNVAGLGWLVELAAAIGRPVHVLLDREEFEVSAPAPEGHFQRFVTEDESLVDIRGVRATASVFGWLRVLPHEDFVVPADAWPAGTRWERDEPEPASEPDASMDVDEESAPETGDAMDTDEVYYGGDPLAPEADQDVSDTGEAPSAPGRPLAHGGPAYTTEDAEQGSGTGPEAGSVTGPEAGETAGRARSGMTEAGPALRLRQETDPSAASRFAEPSPVSVTAPRSAPVGASADPLGSPIAGLNLDALPRGARTAPSEGGTNGPGEARASGRDAAAESSLPTTQDTAAPADGLFPAAAAPWRATGWERSVREVRAGVAGVRVATERVEPSRDAASVDELRRGLVSYDLRRLVVSGVVVRDHTVRVLMRLGEQVWDANLEEVAGRYRRVVDVLNVQARELYETSRGRDRHEAATRGDLFHYTVEFTAGTRATDPGEAPAHVTIVVEPVGVSVTQNHWPSDITDAEIAHEILHGLGVMHGADGGLMSATVPLAAGELPAGSLRGEYVRSIEEVAATQVEIADPFDPALPGVGGPSRPSPEDERRWYGGRDETGTRTLSAPKRPADDPLDGTGRRPSAPGTAGTGPSQTDVSQTPIDQSRVETVGDDTPAHHPDEVDRPHQDRPGHVTEPSSSLQREAIETPLQISASRPRGGSTRNRRANKPSNITDEQLTTLRTLAEEVASTYRNPQNESARRSAVAALDEALDRIPTSAADVNAARNLRAALIYYSENGHLNAPQSKTVPLDSGKAIHVGRWLEYLRGTGLPVARAWARPILDALGMRWRNHDPVAAGEQESALPLGQPPVSDSENSRVHPGERTDWTALLPGLAANVAAQRRGTGHDEGSADPGEHSPYGVAVAALGEALDHIRTSPDYGALDQRAAAHLRVALDFYADKGHLRATAGKKTPVGTMAVDLGQWLLNIRQHGLPPAREWVRPVLDAFGMRWGGRYAPPAAEVEPAAPTGRPGMSGGASSWDNPESGLFPEPGVSLEEEGDPGSWLGWLGSHLDDAGAENRLTHDVRDAEQDLLGAGGSRTGALTGSVSEPAVVPEQGPGDPASWLDWLEDYLGGEEEEPWLLQDLGAEQGILPHNDLPPLRPGPRSDHNGASGRPGRQSAVTQDQANRLKIQAEKVAEAYRHTDLRNGETLEAAVTVLHQELERVQNGQYYSGVDQRVAGILRAALIYFVRNGHVNAPNGEKVNLGYGEVNLGTWLANMRQPQYLQGMHFWITPVLSALGMRWGKGHPDLGESGIRVSSEGQHLPSGGETRNAERTGESDNPLTVLLERAENVGEKRREILELGQSPADSAMAREAVGELRAALIAFEVSPDRGAVEREIARKLRAALDYYVDHGDVNAPQRTKVLLDGKEVSLGAWLNNCRSPKALLAFRALVDPVLVALGMRWGSNYTPLGGATGPASSAGLSLMSGGESGRVDPGGDDLTAVLPVLAADLAEKRTQAVDRSLDYTDRREFVAALDEALGRVQASDRHTVVDQRTARNLRAALNYYVGKGNIDATRTAKEFVGAAEVNVGIWLHHARNRNNFQAARFWVDPVLTALGMRWENHHTLASANASSRPVRGAQASERALKHPEWDLIDEEWELMRIPLERVVFRHARISFDAMMFRFRNGLNIKTEVPKDRYGAAHTGRHQFQLWARAGALSEVMERVEENPGTVRPVVRRALKAALDAALDWMDDQVLSSIRLVPSAEAESEARPASGREVPASPVGGPVPAVAAPWRAAGWEESVGEVRAGVVGVRVETERVEPSSAVVPVGELRRGLVSYDLRRMVVSGVVVRDHTVRVVLRPGGGVGSGGVVSDADLVQVVQRYQRVVDVLNEQARELYGAGRGSDRGEVAGWGDLFHYTVEFAASSAGLAGEGVAPPHVTVVVEPVGVSVTQNHWPVDIGDAEIAHEVLHGLGVMHSDGGLMSATEPLPVGELPVGSLRGDYVRSVEEVAATQVEIAAPYDPALSQVGGPSRPSPEDERRWYGDRDDTATRTLPAPKRRAGDDLERPERRPSAPGATQSQAERRTTAAGGESSQVDPGNGSNWAAVMPELAADFVAKRAAMMIYRGRPAAADEFRAAFTVFDQALVSAGESADGSTVDEEVVRNLRASLIYHSGYGDLEVAPSTTVTLDGREVRLGEWLRDIGELDGTNAHLAWVWQVLTVLGMSRLEAQTPAGGEGDAAVSGGRPETTDGEGGRADSGRDGDLTVAEPEPAGAFGADVVAGAPRQDLAAAGEVLADLPFGGNGLVDESSGLNSGFEMPVAENASLSGLYESGGQQDLEPFLAEDVESLARSAPTWLDGLNQSFPAGDDREQSVPVGQAGLETSLADILAFLPMELDPPGQDLGEWADGADIWWDVLPDVGLPFEEAEAEVVFRSQDDGARSGGAGRGRGVTEGEAVGLRGLAEQVAAAYGQRDPQGEETRSAAVAAFDEALIRIETSRYHRVADRTAARYLRAALVYYAANGKLDAPKRWKESVDGRAVDLGQWLHEARRAGRLLAVRGWVDPVLDALGMRWGGRYVPVGVAVSGGWPVVSDGEGGRVLSGGADLTGVLPGLAVEVAARRGGAVEAGLGLRSGPAGEAFGVAVAALDEALIRIETSRYHSVADQKIARYLRAALVCYVANGNLEVPMRSKPSVDGTDVSLGRWVHNLRGGRVNAGREWIKPVLDALGMRWERGQAPDRDDTGMVPSVAQYSGGEGMRSTSSRPVRGPQASERDLGHPEWDLTDEEWELIRIPLEEVNGRDTRRQIDAVLFRFRNGLAISREVPADRYGTVATGRHHFNRLIRTDALSKVMERVEQNPGVMHPVVLRSLKAALDSAHDLMDHQILRSIAPVTSDDPRAGVQGTAEPEVPEAGADMPGEDCVSSARSAGQGLLDAWRAAGWEESVREVRAGVAGVRVETERVEPSGAVASVEELRRGLVSYDLRRLVVSGVVVRDHAVRVVLRPGGVAGSGGVVTDAVLTEVARRYRDVVDTMNEQARQLFGPGDGDGRRGGAGGDLFHYTVEFPATSAGLAGEGVAPPHATIVVEPVGVSVTQNHWPADITEAEIAHEVLHGLGVMHGEGLMSATVPSEGLPPGSFRPEYVRSIEEVAAGQIEIPEPYDPDLPPLAGPSRPTPEDERRWFGDWDETGTETLAAPKRRAGDDLAGPRRRLSAPVGVASEAEWSGPPGSETPQVSPGSTVVRAPLGRGSVEEPVEVESSGDQGESRVGPGGFVDPGSGEASSWPALFGQAVSLEAGPAVGEESGLPALEGGSARGSSGGPSGVSEGEARYLRVLAADLASAYAQDGPQAGEVRRAAEAALGLALAGIQANSAYSVADRQAAEKLRAALGFFAKYGHMNALRSATERVDGRDVHLGTWLDNVRYRGLGVRLAWVGPVLDALGMRWKEEAPTEGGVPVGDLTAALPGLADDVAERRGEAVGRGVGPKDLAGDEAFGAAFAVFDEALASIRAGRPAGDADASFALHMRAALRFFAMHGHVDTPWSATERVDDQDVKLGIWLTRIRRQHLVLGRSWIVPVLNAWHMRWERSRASADGGVSVGTHLTAVLPGLAGDVISRRGEAVGRGAEPKDLAGDEAFGAAFAVFDEALVGIQTGPLVRDADASFALHMRAALRFFAKHGHVNAPRSATERVDDQAVNLGSWMYDIRRRRLAVGRRWAEPVLDVLGMRGGAEPSAGGGAHAVSPAGRATLPGDGSRRGGSQQDGGPVVRESEPVGLFDSETGADFSGHELAAASDVPVETFLRDGGFEAESAGSAGEFGLAAEGNESLDRLYEAGGLLDWEPDLPAEAAESSAWSAGPWFDGMAQPYAVAGNSAGLATLDQTGLDASAGDISAFQPEEGDLPSPHLEPTASVARETGDLESLPVPMESLDHLDNTEYADWMGGEDASRHPVDVNPRPQEEVGGDQLSVTVQEGSAQRRTKVTADEAAHLETVAKEVAAAYKQRHGEGEGALGRAVEALDEALVRIEKSPSHNGFDHKAALHLREALHFYSENGDLEVRNGPAGTALRSWLERMRRPTSAGGARVWVEPVLDALGMRWGRQHKPIGGGSGGADSGDRFDLTAVLPGLAAEVVARRGEVAQPGEEITDRAASPALGRAVVALHEALARIQNNRRGIVADQDAALYLRGALEHYVASGDVNAPLGSRVPVGDTIVNLGSWVKDLRRHRDGGGVRVWVGPVLDALGMRWGRRYVPAGSDALGGGADPTAVLPGLAAEVVARRGEAAQPGENLPDGVTRTALDTAVGALHEALTAIQNSRSHGLPDQRAARYLRAALDWYVDKGSLNAPKGTTLRVDGAVLNLGLWLKRVRREGVAASRGWLRQVLDTLGMPWPETHAPGFEAGLAASAEQPVTSDTVSGQINPRRGHVDEPVVSPSHGTADPESHLDNVDYYLDILDGAEYADWLGGEDAEQGFVLDDAPLREENAVLPRSGNGGGRNQLMADEARHLQVLAKAMTAAYHQRELLGGGVFDSAVEKLHTMLTGIQSDQGRSRDVRQNALNLRAAVDYYARHGNLEVPRYEMPLLDGTPVSLGAWLASVRNSPHRGGVGVWVEPVLDVLGMRWGGRRVTSEALDLTLVLPGLADQVVARRGEVAQPGENLPGGVTTPELDRAVSALREALLRVQNSRHHHANDQRASRNLRAALDYYVRKGNLEVSKHEPTFLDGAPINLRTWLFDMRKPKHGLGSRVWVEPVLDVLGMRWGTRYVRVGGENGGVVPGDDADLTAVLPGLVAEVVAGWGEAARSGENVQVGDAGSGLDRAVSALHGALLRVQNSRRHQYGDRRAAQNLRAALDFYVGNGHVHAPQGKVVPVDGDNVKLGAWLARLRADGLAPGREWVRPVLTAMGMRWEKLPAQARVDAGAPPSTGEPGRSGRESSHIDPRLTLVSGHGSGALSSSGHAVTSGLESTGVLPGSIDGSGRSASSRPVRDPQAPESDVSHPEWDLTDEEWNLIKPALDGVAGTEKNVRRSFDAIMFRMRKGLSAGSKLPLTRYGSTGAGRHHFYEWAQADVFLGILERVEGNPGVVHPVVEKALRKAFAASQEYLNNRDLRAMPPVTRAHVQPGSHGDSGGNEEA